MVFQISIYGKIEFLRGRSKNWQDSPALPGHWDCSNPYIPRVFTFGETLRQPLFIAGLLILIARLIFYFISVKLLLNGLRNIKQGTSGSFRCSRNPLYAGIILGIIPGIALLPNSWIVLTTSILGYLVLENICGEYTEMESIFGEEYRKYAEATPGFFPWFRK